MAKERFGLRFQSVYGEALSASNEAIHEKMPRLLHIIAIYPLADICWLARLVLPPAAEFEVFAWTCFWLYEGESTHIVSILLQ